MTNSTLKALDQFYANIERARSLAGLSTSLSTITTEAIDLSDILRASLVLSVSALDSFVHEFVRLGMLEVHAGKRPITNAHLRFSIPLSAARIAMSNTSQDEWLDQAIQQAHGWLSFQQPDKIAKAVRLVSSVSLWEQVGIELGKPAKAVEIQLSAIVDRRNKIAHEADVDPTNPGYRWPIDPKVVQEALDFVDSVATAIFKVTA